MRAWDVMTCVGATIGALFILDALLGNLSAVQQGAVATIGIGFAVIPYVVSATLHRGRAERYRETLELSRIEAPAPD